MPAMFCARPAFDAIFRCQHVDGTVIVSEYVIGTYYDAFPAF